jgi:hypothetical protein
MYNNYYILYYKIHNILLKKGNGKGKAVPLQAWSDPEGSIKVKQSHYRHGVTQRVP